MSTSFAWSRIRTIPMVYPFAFGVGLSTVKTSFSDLLVQRIVEKRETIDWRRNLAFGAFGCFYLGGVQYLIYVPLFGRLFPNCATFAAKSLKDKLQDTQGLIQLTAQVFLDQCIHHVFLYFPCFYIVKEFVMRDKPSVENALTEYKHNMKDDLVALWKIWVPVTFFNFAFMPMYGRIPCVAATSLLWTCILSSMRGGDVVHSDDMVGGSVRGASFTLLKEGLGNIFTSPVDLDPTMAHVCISAAGPDRIGWVSMVAKKIADEHGSITHSKMIRLGSDFIMLAHVAVAPEHVKDLIASLNKDEKLAPLNLRTSFLSKRQTSLHSTPVMSLRIHCVGEDRIGMLAAIAGKLSEVNISVENLTTELRMGHGGRREFVIDAECVSSQKLNKDDLNQLFHDFSLLKEELGFDVLDVRVNNGL